MNNELTSQFEDDYKMASFLDARSSFSLGKESILAHRRNMRLRIDELTKFLNIFKKEASCYLSEKKSMYIGHTAYITLRFYKVELSSKTLLDVSLINLEEFLVRFKRGWRTSYFEEFGKIVSKELSEAGLKESDRLSEMISNHIDNYLGDYLFSVILSEDVADSHILEDFPDSYRDHFEFDSNPLFQEEIEVDPEELGRIVNDAFSESFEVLNDQMMRIKQRLVKNSYRSLIDAVLKKGSAAHYCTKGLAVFSSAVMESFQD